MLDTAFVLQWSAILAWFIFCVAVLPRWLTIPNASPRDRDSAGGCSLAIFVTVLGIVMGWVAERWVGALSLGAATAILGILMAACSAL